MAQSGHVHHHPEFQYGGLQTRICKSSSKSRDKRRCISASRQDINGNPTALPRFWAHLSIEMDTDTVWLNRKRQNPRWRSLNFKFMYLCFQTRYQRNPDGYTYVFGVKFPLGLMRILYDQTGNGNIQDGGLQTSNACISASRQDINEIPTVMPMFFGSSFPLELVAWLSDQTGSGKIQDGCWHSLIACFSAPGLVA